MNNEGFDPRLLRTGRVRIDDPKATGGKFYRAAYQRGKSTRWGRGRFHSAAEAEGFAQKVKARWVRLWFLEQAQRAEVMAIIKWTVFWWPARDWRWLVFGRRDWQLSVGGGRMVTATGTDYDG